MGLLDDAIREHLDLKRRRGADPGEVAREQREALEPVPRGETADAEENPALAAERDASAEAPLGAAGTPPVDDLAGDGDPSQPSPEGEPVVPAGGDETAELDMQSVLGGNDAGQSVENTPTGSAPDDRAPTPAETVLEEDSLEWEVPGEVAEEELEEEQPADDVLEETPDFLRDTPEQERLWFEQRPPRDFDFDK